MDCAYCGIAPMTEFKKNNRKTLLYNGIDRVNSDLPYSNKNCVPCCKDCNWAKIDKPIHQWVSWLKRISIRIDQIEKISLTHTR